MFHGKKLLRAGKETIYQPADFLKMRIHGYKFCACFHCLCCNPDIVGRNRRSLLWREFEQTGNIKALETLLAYNIEDVVNLETLMVLAYNMKLKETPFSRTHALPLPEIPDIPFKPDRATIERIRQKWQFY
jgi:hypothetical protein